jgi:hypothetical protein
MAQQTIKRRSPINRAVVKDMVLDMLGDVRPALKDKLKRVSKGTLDHLEARVKRRAYNIVAEDLETFLDAVIKTELESLPTNGQTIRIGGY